MSVKTWYDDHIVSRIVRYGCASSAVGARRAQIIPMAAGHVFEIGCGGGANQPFYDRSKITSYAGIEPSGKLLDHARQQAALNGWDADIREGVGEAIPFENESFDTVVATFTLCSVQVQVQVLQEIRRVLKPGGRFLFLEHGLAPDHGVRAFQHRVEPAWKTLMGGCHLTRPIGEAVSKAGFEVVPVSKGYMARMPKFASWMEWGFGVRQG